ncbi:MAG: MFS transporter [Euryarchaeota archaeon]|nr:MFS transporter [Euryarchaeota archaeon]
MSEGFIRVLKNKDFLYLWIGQLISNFGDRFAWMGMIVFVYDTTESATNLGVLMIFLAMPSLLFGSFAGVFVDRWNRKRVMVISDILRGILYGSLLFVSPISQYCGINELYYIYTVAFLSAAIMEFFYPARASVIPNIVDEKDLMTANSLSQTTMYVSTIMGPALAGLTIGIFGAKAAFGIDACSFLISALCIALMKIQSEIMEENLEFFKEWVEGFRICIRTKPILFTLILFSIVMLAAGSVNVLSYPFAVECLGVDKLRYGFLTTMNGVGMICGALLLGTYLKDMKPGKMILSSMIIGGVALGMVGFLQDFQITLFLFIFVGVLNASINIASTTILQKSVEDKNRGKVFGITGMIITVFNILSMGSAGFLGDYFGIAVVMTVVGILIFLLGVFGRFIPGYEET